MVTLNRNDLPHILSQIRIAEDYMALINGGADPAAALAPLLTNPLVPFGLRTVDGAYSKFQPDMVHFGASDTLMTRMLTPELRDAEAGTSYGSTSGTVIDSQPRMISNLVADQSLDNPAAIAVALTINGYEGQDCWMASAPFTRRIWRAIRGFRRSTAFSRSSGSSLTMVWI